MANMNCPNCGKLVPKVSVLKTKTIWHCSDCGKVSRS